MLIGLMAVGKTTVGHLVAKRLDWPVTDSDAEIRKQQGRTAREIADAEGTAALHELEAAHLLTALGAPGPQVICAAASTIDRERCRLALQSPEALVFWLTAPPTALAARSSSGAHRPIDPADAAGILSKQLAARERGLREVALEAIPTTEMSPEEIASIVVQAVAMPAARKSRSRSWR
ncbi:MAG TPA: shikimate kinase [Solirubrobacterales bacterium]|nr:shikimate kinase [Solirubrobacterales bacterium]